MKTKKITALSAIAMIMLSAALVIGCMQPMGASGIKTSGDASGSVTPGRNVPGIYLNIKPAAARTILPAINTDDSGFEYLVEFFYGTATLTATAPGTAINIGANAHNTTANYSNAIVSVLEGLGAGIQTYNIAVRVTLYDSDTTPGYTDSSGLTSYSTGGFAQGFATGLTIDIDASNQIDGSADGTLTVPLTLFDNKLPAITGLGRFTYIVDWTDFQHEARIDTAVFSITNLDNSPVGTTNANVNIKAGTTGTNIDTIPAGVYNVVYTIQLDGTSGPKAVLREKLHIYQNMVTTFSLVNTGDFLSGNGISNDLFPSAAITVVVTGPGAAGQYLQLTYSGFGGTPDVLTPGTRGEITLSISNEDYGTFSMAGIGGYTITGTPLWTINNDVPSLGHNAGDKINDTAGVFTIGWDDHPNGGDSYALDLTGVSAGDVIMIQAEDDLYMGGAFLIKIVP